jgi:hypothetical protein
MDLSDSNRTPSTASPTDSDHYESADYYHHNNVPAIDRNENWNIPSDETSADYDDVETSAGAIDEHRPSQRPRLHTPPLLQHFPGDGLDFRRPRTSLTSSPTTPSTMDEAPDDDDMVDVSPRIIRPLPTVQVIDLTSDDEDAGRLNDRSHNGSSSRTSAIHATLGRATRGPRFGAEIIDLSEDLPETAIRPPPPADRDRESPPQSPEIQFVSERQLRLPTPPPLPPNMAARTSYRQPTITLDDGDDEIEITGTRTIRQGAGMMMAAAAAAQAAMRHVNGGLLDIDRMLDGLLGGRENHAAQREGFRVFAAPRRPPVLVRRGNGRGNGRWVPVASNQFVANNQFVAPDFDFGAVGFDLGLDREDTASPPIPPLPPPPAGQTRSPTEGGICPNCGDELSEGDTDIKRQIWLAKCGHVSGICLGLLEPWESEDHSNISINRSTAANVP